MELGLTDRSIECQVRLQSDLGFDLNVLTSKQHMDLSMSQQQLIPRSLVGTTSS